MIIKTYEDEQSWLDDRKGKITGSKLKDLIVKKGTGEKKGFYQLIAERVALPDDEATPTDPMDRGKYLESIALERFEKETGKKLNKELVMWVSEENEKIAYSPDGFVEGKKIKECVEVKCLSSSSHIEAYITQKIPSEYEYQKIQAFIVNPDLQKTYWTFYDPRIKSKDFFIIEVNRKDIEDDIKFTSDMEKEKLALVEGWVEKLLF